MSAPLVKWSRDRGPGGFHTASLWWEVTVSTDGTSYLVEYEAREVTVTLDGRLQVDRAHRATWVPSAEVWRPIDQCRPPTEIAIEAYENTGAHRHGVAVETDDGWILRHIGVHPIQWWRGETREVCYRFDGRVECGKPMNALSSNDPRQASCPGCLQLLGRA